MSSPTQEQVPGSTATDHHPSLEKRWAELTASLSSLSAEIAGYYPNYVDHGTEGLGIMVLNSRVSNSTQALKAYNDHPGCPTPIPALVLDTITDLGRFTRTILSALEDPPTLDAITDWITSKEAGAKEAAAVLCTISPYQTSLIKGNLVTHIENVIDMEQQAWESIWPYEMGLAFTAASITSHPDNLFAHQMADKLRQKLEVDLVDLYSLVSICKEDRIRAQTSGDLDREIGKSIINNFHTTKSDAQEQWKASQSSGRIRDMAEADGRLVVLEKAIDYARAHALASDVDTQTVLNRRLRTEYDEARTHMLNLRNEDACASFLESMRVAAPWLSNALSAEASAYMYALSAMPELPTLGSIPSSKSLDQIMRSEEIALGAAILTGNNTPFEQAMSELSIYTKRIQSEVLREDLCRWQTKYQADSPGVMHEDLLSQRGLINSAGSLSLAWQELNKKGTEAMKRCRDAVVDQLLAEVMASGVQDTQFQASEDIQMTED